MAQARKYADDDGKLNIGSLLVARAKKYSDIDALFEPTPTNKDLYLKKDAGAVKQSIKLLILTRYGERPYQPYIGTSLQLFELMDTNTEVLLEKEILRTIQNNEPRASNVRVEVNSSPSENLINIRIEFQVINIQEIQTLELTLDRLR